MDPSSDEDIAIAPQANNVTPNDGLNDVTCVIDSLPKAGPAA